MQSQIQTDDAQAALHRHALAAEQPGAYDLAAYFEACLSCGKRFTLTGAPITVLCVEGRVEVCKVCPTCAQRRGLV